MFTSITFRSSSTIRVLAGCQIQLQSHFIQPDSATTDSDLDTIHNKWTWDLNVLFPTYHKEVVHDYLKDTEQIKNKNPNQVTSSNNVRIIVLTLIAVQTCYCMFKICFTPSHNIRPPIPTYKLRK
jgi:hypothetical protein